MKKKITALLLVVALVAVAVAGSTMAYFTDTAQDVNVSTVGNVKIAQHEYERVLDENGNPVKGVNGTDFEANYGITESYKLQPYTQGKPAFPAVYTNGTEAWDNFQQLWNGVGAPGSNDLFSTSMKNVLDKFVFVENTGKSDLYYRTWIAVECPEGMDHNLIHLSVNGNSRFAWEELGYVTIGGNRYMLYLATYNEILTPGEVSRPSLLQYYLDPEATNKEAALLGDTWEILVFTQAVQAAGFADAETALNTAFPDAHPWKSEEPRLPILVSTAAELQAALDSAVDGDTIVFADDITGNVTATQKPDTKITIDGNGYTFAGVMTVDGKSATYLTAGLTIKDLTFKADSISADACIRLGDGTDATRYTCNVTVDGCTFDVPGAVGVKSYTGGDKNLVITGCTATSNAHSLIQAKGIDGVLVEKCNVNSKNGLNFNNSDNVKVVGCKVNVLGYAVRFGESSGGTGAAETYLIDSCVLTSANDDGDATIILRGTADNSTLTIVNTEINGTPDIANTASGATVK